MIAIVAISLAGGIAWVVLLVRLKRQRDRQFNRVLDLFGPGGSR